MSVLTYTPQGVLYSESRGLKAITSYNKTKGISTVYIYPSYETASGGTRVVVTYTDKYYTTVTFSSFELCKKFFMRKVPGKVYIWAGSSLT
jgi:hypothetical protein